MLDLVIPCRITALLAEGLQCTLPVAPSLGLGSQYDYSSDVEAALAGILGNLQFVSRYNHLANENCEMSYDM